MWQILKTRDSYWVEGIKKPPSDLTFALVVMTLMLAFGAVGYFVFKQSESNYSSVETSVWTSSAEKTVEAIPATTTTVVLICDPPEHLDCAGARLEFANLSYADLTGANLTGASLVRATLTGVTMPDGTMPDKMEP